MVQQKLLFFSKYDWNNRTYEHRVLKYGDDAYFRHRYLLLIHSDLLQTRTLNLGSCRNKICKLINIIVNERRQLAVGLNDLTTLYDLS